jgi:hypothetical protein
MFLPIFRVYCFFFEFRIPSCSYFPYMGSPQRALPLLAQNHLPPPKLRLILFTRLALCLYYAIKDRPLRHCEGEVAHTMYTYVIKCKFDKIKNKRIGFQVDKGFTAKNKSKHIKNLSG